MPTSRTSYVNYCAFTQHANLECTLRYIKRKGCMYATTCKEIMSSSCTDGSQELYKKVEKEKK